MRSLSLSTPKRGPSMPILKPCENCGKTVITKAYAIAKGKGRFCSRECFNTDRREPLAERLKRRSEPDLATGCILWTGKCADNGYGHTEWQGNTLLVHRVAYESACGPIPEGQMVLHRCDTRRCINPDHLFTGTHADNMADMAEKGRHCHGERHLSARFTDKIVLAIREKWASGAVSEKRLAQEYSTSQATIWQIVSGKTWKHLPVPPSDAGLRDWACGERSPKSKLTAEKVVEIRRLHASGCDSKRLARQFAVADHTIRMIVKRKYWKHVP